MNTKGTLRVSFTSKSVIELLNKNKKYFLKQHPDLDLNFSYIVPNFDNKPDRETFEKKDTDILLYFGKKVQFPNAVCEKIAQIEDNKLDAIYNNYDYPPAKIIHFLVFLQQIINKNLASISL